MRLILPRRTLWLRWNTIFCFLGILVWSTPEEDRLVFAALLGVWAALTLCVSWVSGRFPGVIVHGWTAAATLVFSGALIGAAANVCAVLLMIFKDARHAHVFPDYPPVLLVAMLGRLPAWTIAGCLTGLGVALAITAYEWRSSGTASSASLPVL